jgi:tetratricopeptide (TPR) repeat protein
MTESSLTDLLETMPPEVVGALELVAVPHWTDDPLAIALMERFGETNGTSPRALGEIKSLPFIGPHGHDGWRVVAPVADALRSRLERDRVLALDVEAFLARWLAQSEQQLPSSEPQARELQWRAIYHLTAVEPSTALGQLDRFMSDALPSDRQSDLRAAVQLIRARRHLLHGFDAEMMFIEGRYAFANGDYPGAESCFLAVWDSSTDPHRRVVAGHLLGVIRSKRAAWREAEAILCATVMLAHETGDGKGEATTLTTLGSMLAHQGGKKRLELADGMLRYALELSSGEAATAGPGEVYDRALLLSALGGVLSQRGGDGLYEAEAHLQESLEIAPPSLRSSIIDRFADVLSRLGGRARFGMAEQVLRDYLATAGTTGQDEAVKLHTLVDVMLRSGQGDLSEAKELIERSIELGRASGDIRHEAMASFTASRVAERRCDLPEALRLMRRVTELNEQLGLETELRESQRRVRKLERRIER